MRSIIVFLAALSIGGAACGGSLTPSPDAGDAGGGDAADFCLLPWDPGPCAAVFPVYAFVDGACVMRTYGGCEGNANRFTTPEQCMGVCAVRPAPGGCPPNRVAREICIGCGPVGGCSQMATVCALLCDVDAGPNVCEGSLPLCWEGVCQYALCD